MKHHELTEIRDQLPAYLDGTLDEVTAARVRQCIESSTVCRQEVEALEALTRDLQGLGDALVSNAPVIDLVDSVMHGIALVKGDETVLAPLAGVDSADVLEALADQPSVQERLAADSPFREEVDTLRGLHAELNALGEAWCEAAPEVDLVDAVMGRVAAYKQEAEAGIDPVVQSELDAFMEDALDTEGMLRLEQVARANPVVSAEFEALRAMKTDLEALGDAIAPGTSEIDLVDSVLRRVEHKPAAVVPFRSHRKPAARRPAPVWRWVGVAAAAVVLVVLGMALRPVLFTGMDSGRQQTAEHPNTVPESPAAPDGSVEDPSSGTGQDGLELARVLPKPLLLDPEPHGPRETSRTKARTLQEVLNERRNALLKDMDSLDKLGQWASLAPEEARELLEQTGLSPEAILGAAQFLPEEEAAAVLRAAVDANPEDPYLRFALAQNTPDVEEAQDQTAKWQELDEANALPAYMGAELYFEAGDAESAVAVLEGAGAQEAASSYALDSARYQEEALVASGMDADVARLLVASTAGNREYGNLTQLGQDLLRYGNEYEAAGDLETAQMIYGAVENMGVQLATGASLVNEQMAGLTVESAALQAILGIAEVLQQPETILLLQDAIVGVSDMILSMTSFMESYDSQLQQDGVADALSLADEVMAGNELGLFKLFW